MTRSEPIAPDPREMEDIHRGNRLAPGEELVWRGRASTRGVIRDVFHLRAIAGYFAALLAFDVYQAWAKRMTLAKAVHDSVPLVVVAVLALCIVAGLAVATARTLRYTLTDRRVILHFGVALPAVLSLPFSQITSCAVAVRRDHTGDIALTLKAGNRMPILKLWPLARAWRISEPQPMLRAVPQAAVVSGLIARALQVAHRERRAAVEPTAIEVAAPQRLSA